MKKTYASPLDQLLAYGDCREIRKWPDYPKLLGLKKEHIPELIQMATDDDLHWADSDSSEVWAPIHAWRSLAQLKATEAIEPLLELFSNEEDDWIGEELPEVYGMLGPEAIPVLTRYIADKTRGLSSRISAARGLAEIPGYYPDARGASVQALVRQLERFEQNDPEFNGFLISYLMDLKAVEVLSVIREAYEKNCVDFTIVGDFEDVEIEMGLKKVRTKPADYPGIADKYFPEFKEDIEKLRKILSVSSSEAESEGDEKIPPKRKKVGRNDPCPCGSGKKYKKCCLK